jgi:hypothetical protein
MFECFKITRFQGFEDFEFLVFEVSLVSKFLGIKFSRYQNFEVSGSLSSEGF